MATAKKKPSAAQLAARKLFAQRAKAGAFKRKATGAKKRAVKVKRKAGKPSPAQLAAQAKFVAMVKAKAKAKGKVKKNSRGFSTRPPSWVGTKKKATKRKKRNPGIIKMSEAEFAKFAGKIKGVSAPTRTRTVSATRQPATKRKKTFKKVGIFGGSGFLGLGRSVQKISRNPKRKKNSKRVTRERKITRARRQQIVYRRQHGAPAKGGFKWNPAPSKVFTEFRGKDVTRSTKLRAATGTPSTLAELGKLRELRLRGKTLRFSSGRLAADGKKKLHIVGIKLRDRKNPGGEMDYGEIISVTYEADKPHVEKGIFNYQHKFGEEGGTRPHLVVDEEGYPKIEGGSYGITADGIID